MQIDFSAPAVLKKWPSLGGERHTSADAPDPYSVVGGTLDECIRKFLALPLKQRHLYEIHTTSQPDLITAVMSAEHIAEIARLKDFL